MDSVTLTIIIPSRNERFLKPTILDLLKNARGNIEIIPILDGYEADFTIDDPRVRFLHKEKSEGMRAGINDAVALAKGEYLMKIDGHCLVSEGFDVELLKNIGPNWIIIPRRKRLDAENWCIQDVGKPDVDYEYLSFPDNPADFGGAGLNGRIWTERALNRKDIMIDDSPASQGSCWLMSKDYFHELELMDEKNYGTFWCESQELAFKCILSGGRYVVNKNAYYAHLHKGKKYGRGYNLDHAELPKGRNQTMRYFTGEKVWHKQKYPLSYLLEKFMPMPEWTDEDIKQLKERESKYWHD